MNKRLKELSMVALFPALMAATAGISVPLFNLPPITLQTFFVLLAGLLLGPSKASLSMTIYLILGIIGIPVFSGFRSGLGVLLGNSGGFLMGFVFAAFIVGLMKNVNFLNKNIAGYFVILLVGTTVIYMCGASYIALINNISIWPIIPTFALYIPGDILKAFTAVLVYVRVHSFVKYEWA